MQDIPDGSIDMVLCDLPYGVTHFDWDKPLPLQDWSYTKDILGIEGYTEKIWLMGPV